MNKKKVLIFIGLVLTFLLVIVFFPWKTSYEKFNNDCKDYCEDLKNAPGLRRYMYGLECELPVRGCFTDCVGFKTSEKCYKTSKCFDSCEITCFGWGISSCTLNVVERKINFFSNKSRK
jgi:hypothetical protein